MWKVLNVVAQKYSPKCEITAGFHLSNAEQELLKRKRTNSEVEITRWLKSKYLERIWCSGEVAGCAGCPDPTLPEHSQEKLWILKQLKSSASCLDLSFTLYQTLKPPHAHLTVKYKISRLLFHFSGLVPELHVAGFWRKNHSVLLLFLLSSYTITAPNHRDWNRGCPVLGITWTLGIICMAPLLLARSGVLDPSRSFNYLLSWVLGVFLVVCCCLFFSWELF